MKSIKRIFCVIMSALAIFSLTACYNKGINEKVILLRMGIDYLENSFVLTLKTLSLNSIDTEDTLTPSIITVKGDTIKTAIDLAKMQLEANIYFSHADSVIIGLSAIDRLSTIADYLNANKEVRLSTAIFIGESAKEILYNEEDKIHPLDLIERIETAGDKITELFELNRKLENNKNYTLPYLSLIQNENGKKYAILDKTATFLGLNLLEIN